MFGTIIVWVLVRYRFPGRRLFDAIVDLPFALPTAVAGIALTHAVRPERLARRARSPPLGIKVAFTPLGIFVALIFIGLPFVVRTVQPVLIDLDPEIEEAAASLGASRWQTVFRVILPSLIAGAADRLRARVRARRRRIRLGHLHRRQPAERLGDRAAADRDPAVRIPLCRRDRDRRRHAGGVVPDHLRDQSPAALGADPYTGALRAEAMSTQSGLAPPPPFGLRAAADLAVAPPSTRDEPRPRAVTSPQNLRTEPGPVRCRHHRARGHLPRRVRRAAAGRGVRGGVFEGRRRLFRRARRSGGAVPRSG